MPIDIPPDKLNLPPPRKSGEAEAVKSEAIKGTSPSSKYDGATLKAVVTEVIQNSVAKVQEKTLSQANANQLQTQKNVYEALLTINPKSSNNGRPAISVNQLDNQIIAQATSGRTIEVKVTTQAPLQVGQQLKVQLQGQALKLLEIAPPDLKPNLQHFIRHEVNQQNSYVYLLSKLMSIAQAIRTQNLLLNTSPVKTDSTLPKGQSVSNSALPGNSPKAESTKSTNQSPINLLSGKEIKQLDTAIKRFIAALPTKSDAVTAEGLKQAIQNSGVFYEKNLLKLFQPTNTTKPESTAGKASTTVGEGKPEMIQQIKQHIKNLQSSLNEATHKLQRGKVSDSGPLLNQVARDLKFNLLNLQKQLEDMQSQSKVLAKSDQPPTQNTAPQNITKTAFNTEIKDNGVTTASKPVDKLTDKSAALQKPDISEKLAEKKLQQPNIQNADKKSEGAKPREQRLADKAAQQKPDSPIYQRPTNSSVTTTSSATTSNTSTSNTSTSQATNAYTVTDKLTAENSGKSNVLDPLIHPPLPGKINIQAQSIRPQIMAKDSLADALISVLIKHTREAASRLNLHQLANATESVRQDGGPQPSLSFELPILNQQDLSLFQFRIQEEELEGNEGKAQTNKEKKWVVHMGFDLEGLGPMYCQITLIGVSASVTFWAEEHHTVNHSKQYIDSLRSNLSNIGVTVKEIQCLEGSPPQDQSGIKQTLIDIET